MYTIRNYIIIAMNISEEQMEKIKHFEVIINECIELLPDNLPLDWSQKMELYDGQIYCLPKNYNVMDHCANITSEKCHLLLSYREKYYSSYQDEILKHFFMGLPSKYIIYKFWLNLVKHDYSLLKYVPQHYLTKKLCLASLKYFSDIDSIQNIIPKKYLTEKFCKKAIKINKIFFRYIPQKFMTKKMCISSIKEHFTLIQYVPKKLLSFDVLKTFFTHADLTYSCYYIGSLMPNELKDNVEILMVIINCCDPICFFQKIENIKIIYNLSDDKIMSMICSDNNIFDNVEQIPTLKNRRKQQEEQINLANDFLVLEFAKRIRLLKECVNGCFFK